ncbi:MAG: hypothetical protein ACR2P9_01015 [Gammaproteobacteria bacterium]
MLRQTDMLSAKISPVLSSCLLLVSGMIFPGTQGLAAVSNLQHEPDRQLAVAADMPVLLAQAGERQRPPVMPVIPATPGNGSRVDGMARQCMTVCARWEEECVDVRQGDDDSGGRTEDDQRQKCRRACTQFLEECF